MKAMCVPIFSVFVRVECQGGAAVTDLGVPAPHPSSSSHHHLFRREDYAAKDILDKYDDDVLDTRAQRPMTFEERLAAERAMEERDERGTGRLPRAFAEESEGASCWLTLTPVPPSF
jgi:hypothetical protein